MKQQFFMGQLTGTVLVIAFLAVPLANTRAAASDSAALTLFDFRKGFATGQIKTTDATVKSENKTLKLQLGTKSTWPGITLAAPGGKWDLTRYQCVEVTVKNTGTTKASLTCRVDNPGADGSKNCITASTELEPGASGAITVSLSPSPWRLSEKIELIGMRGYPGRSEKLNPANVTQLLLFANKPKTNCFFEIASIHARGQLRDLDVKTFFPFIDEFGQFIPIDWPGKLHSTQDFPKFITAEEKDMAAHAGPKDVNKYGGWTGGVQLKATGFFRVEKNQGKWWLVDPEGRLFWSHGVDCVRMENSTPITDREHYYRNLPTAGSPLAKFYGNGHNAAHGYYETKAKYKTYDFSGANLLRKYGEKYAEAFTDVTHRRLKSWGMNTIANWSDSKIYGQRRTPYTATIGFGSKNIEASKGYWRKFYDVFDPSFRENARKAMAAQVNSSVGDLWCIGYYVHNEESWGTETSLALATLASPATQPAKLVFVADLKAKYSTIDKLNAVWGTAYASWDALQQSTAEPDVKKAGDDLRAFYQKLAETYFRTIRDEIKRVAPNQLYLGCRFAWVNDIASIAATKYCDVVSFNRYQYSVEKDRLPNNIDLPTIIGEFHFGALDRGMFHTGLKKTENQQDRALKYKEYVQGALRNPQIVGTHWFQYKDQATTGRSDGENYQIGFVDTCDTPYPEIVAASREVGYLMYPYRLKAQ
jgi:hypothetical protein